MANASCRGCNMHFWGEHSHDVKEEGDDLSWNQIRLYQSSCSSTLSTTIPGFGRKWTASKRRPVPLCNAVKMLQPEKPKTLMPEAYCTKAVDDFNTLWLLTKTTGNDSCIMLYIYIYISYQPKPSLLCHRQCRVNIDSASLRVSRDTMGAP